MLIAFAGLPGSGKSALANELARKIGAAYLRIDSIEQAIAGSSLGRQPVGEAGYSVGYAVAEDNLRNGATVIADSVNPLEVTRAAWLAVAGRAGRDCIEVEVICSDAAEHRQRIETRSPDIPGLKLPTWQRVVDREYHPWNRDRVVIDTAGKSVSQSLDELLALAPDLRPQEAPGIDGNAASD